MAPLVQPGKRVSTLVKVTREDDEDARRFGTVVKAVGKRLWEVVYDDGHRLVADVGKLRIENDDTPAARVTTTTHDGTNYVEEGDDVDADAAEEDDVLNLDKYDLAHDDDLEDLPVLVDSDDDDDEYLDDDGDDADDDDGDDADDGDGDDAEDDDADKDFDGGADDDDDQEDYAPENPHALARYLADVKIAAMEGDIITVQNKSSKTSDEWEVIANAYEDAYAAAELMATIKGFSWHTRWTAAEVFLHLLPGTLTDMVKNINTLSRDDFDLVHRNTRWSGPVTPKELLTFFAIIISAPAMDGKGKALWETFSEGMSPAPDMGRWGLSKTRFEEIRGRASYAWGVGAEDDAWRRFRPFVEAFNQRRAEVVEHGYLLPLDESMSAWKPRTTKTGGLPNISFIKRKPKPLGTEFKCVGDGATGIMLRLEIQEGKEAMANAAHVKELGATAACTLRLAEAVAPPVELGAQRQAPTAQDVAMLAHFEISAREGGFAAAAAAADDAADDAATDDADAPVPPLVVADSWFGSVKACVALGKQGKHAIMMVKTAHARYPKDFMEEALEDAPGGTQCVCRTVIEGIPLIAIGYRYNRKTVLCFVATNGAGASTYGKPYVATYTDRFGNVRVRYVDRGVVIARFFSRSNVIDAHNHRRQHELGLESAWITKDPYFRLATTGIGMNVVDSELAIMYFKPLSRYAKMTTTKFADVLGFELWRLGQDLTKLPDRHKFAPENAAAGAGGTAVVVPSVDTLRAIAATGRLSAGLEHKPCKYPMKASGPKAKNPFYQEQHMCAWCSRIDRVRTMTSYYCEQCAVPLCRNKKCWDKHVNYPGTLFAGSSNASAVATALAENAKGGSNKRRKTA
ncbi:hypothetical protein RI054_25g106450 [Pseudoscourfieldia marina]